MNLAFIEFEARILGLSLETKIFLIRKKSSVQLNWGGV